MAGLTPEEQAFFESGGDTSKLAPDAQQLSALDNAGLSNADPAPVAAPPVAAPVAAPEVQPPVAQPDDFLRSTLAQTQQQAANLQAELDALRNAPKPSAPAPDPNADPLGSMLHQLDQVNRNVADLQAKLLEQQNQQTQTQAFQRFQSQVQGLRDEFLKTAPDFQTAYDYIRTARAADLRAYGVSEADIPKQIFNEEFTLSQAAIAQAKNPAAELYEMAKRHGYKAQAVAAPATVHSNEAKIAALKAGVAASPPALPRSPGVEEITLDSLREASDADLNKLISDPAAWHKIAGKDHIPI